jgi:hypothetical protein
MSKTRYIEARCWEQGPQGLKPNSNKALEGAAEAVPYPNRTGCGQLASPTL